MGCLGTELILTIPALIKNYNTFIEDLGQLNEDISEIVLKYNIKWMYEFWGPYRDRPNWVVKKKFASKYQNKKEVFYVGFDLEDDCPYLLLERMYDIKNYTPDDFTTDNDSFAHLLDPTIPKITDENNNGGLQEVRHKKRRDNSQRLWKSVHEWKI